MSATVVRDPTQLTMTVDPDGTPIEVELCDFVRAVRIEGTADEIDISTFCQTATELGAVKWSIVLATLWSPEAYAAFEAHVGKDAEFRLKPGDQSAPKSITWRGKYAFAPFGNFELGARVESDLPLAVTVPPAYTDDPVGP